MKSWLDVSLWTPRPSPQLGVILTTITHCNVTARQRNTWYGLCAAFLNAVRGDRRYCRPLSKRGNEISLHTASHYTPQEVNAIIRITRHLGSRGGVETKIPLLHDCRHKAQCAPDLGQCCKSNSKKKKKSMTACWPTRGVKAYKQLQNHLQLLLDGADYTRQNITAPEVNQCESKCHWFLEQSLITATKTLKSCLFLSWKAKWGKAEILLDPLNKRRVEHIWW